MKLKLEIINMPQEKIDDALAQAKASLSPETLAVFKAIAHNYSTLLTVLQKKDMTMARLRKALFGPAGEKTRHVLHSQAGAQDNERPGAGQAKAPQPGHGRNGPARYWAAKTQRVAHHRLKSGDRCPGCRKGKVYDQRDRPGTLVRVTGQPPLTATVYHLEKLRCNLCGDIFEARPPQGVGRRKYDESASSMIGLLKYGGGLPWNRLHKIQGALGIPLPPSTQWEIVKDASRNLLPAHEELGRKAAQGAVLHNDDTAMKILERMGKRRQKNLRNRLNGNGDTDQPEEPNPNRTGVFTSGIVSRVDGRRIALFFTGARHAGENLKALLAKRASSLGPPIQMCDALSRNLPKNFKTILAHCLAHGRRQFVDLIGNFPDQCAYVLRILGKVYQNDAIAKKRRMTLSERLRFHQANSAPLMKRLRAWMEAQITQKRIEPNSALGEAIGYMLKHWDKLTLFLRKTGAPLDNNICERALKKAILHRKNSLFYKTDNGARAGDIFMSLIHTCDLNEVDPFDYLTELQRHAKELRANPGQWMPWNYRRTIARAPPRLRRFRALAALRRVPPR